MPIIQNRFHHLVDEILKLRVTIVGHRPHDDLPCYVCAELGRVIVLKVGHDTTDVCASCARLLGIVW